MKSKKRLFRTLSAIVLSIAIFLPVLAPFAQPAYAGLQAVGPVDPNTGFPVWYQDSNGLALELMEAADPFGISAPVEPGSAFSEQIGFGAEGFWWAADASIEHPSVPAGRALLVLAMEAAFAGEEAIDGEQSAFGRLRMTFDVPQPGTYTVFHPYGQQSFVVGAVGPGPEVQNAGSDIGCFAIAGIASCDPNTPPGNPVNFGVALQSAIGPFLTWDTFNLNPALTDPLLVNAANPTKRYIGNPSFEHRITGSPIGQNIFRIEGPNIGGPGIDFIETDLFTVAGRIAVIDTEAPVLVSTSPAAATVGSNDVVVNVSATDNLGITDMTVDLGAFGNALTATLNGANIPSASPATGSGTFTINTVANTLSFNIALNGLTGGAETGAHIHATIAPGSLFDLPLGNSKVGVWNYPEAFENDILAGNFRVHIHTQLFPAGEISGPIVVSPNIQHMVLTAGTRTNGTWGSLIANVGRLGAFNLPVSITDGSNITTGTLALNVIPVLSSATIAPANTTLTAGATQQLTSAGFDAQGGAITTGLTTNWTSSNLLVATVNASGLVTAVAPGSATITGSVTNGINTAANTAAITVNAASSLTSVNVTPATASVIIGGTQQMTASPLNQNGNAFVGATVTWTSSNSTVATVSASGLVTGVSVGTATITGRAISGATIVNGTASITVTEAPVCQTGADANGNNAISTLEIINYVRDWKSGLVSNLLLLRAIGLWKAGVGC